MKAKNLFISCLIGVIFCWGIFCKTYASPAADGWHWNCTYNNGRLCRVCNNTSDFCCGGMSMDSFVTDKINLRLDWQLQNETIASNQEKLANNFTNEVANMTAIANSEIEASTARITDDILSIETRNRQLQEYATYGANVTEEDLMAKNSNVVSVLYACAHNEDESYG